MEGDGGREQNIKSFLGGHEAYGEVPFLRPLHPSDKNLMVFSVPPSPSVFSVV